MLSGKFKLVVCACVCVCACVRVCVCGEWAEDVVVSDIKSNDVLYKIP